MRRVMSGTTDYDATLRLQDTCDMQETNLSNPNETLGIIKEKCTGNDDT